MKNQNNLNSQDNQSLKQSKRDKIQVNDQSSYFSIKINENCQKDERINNEQQFLAMNCKQQNDLIKESYKHRPQQNMFGYGHGLKSFPYQQKSLINQKIQGYIPQHAEQINFLRQNKFVNAHPRDLSMKYQQQGIFQNKNIKPQRSLQENLSKKNRLSINQSVLMHQHSSLHQQQIPSIIDGFNPTAINPAINLHIRSQLIRRSRKYQISTNNAHKKYINCLKNLFYQALSHEQIQQFQTRYIKSKSSRAFFFIILVYVKYRFTPQLGLAVKMGFQKQMNQRIKQYEQQIYRCSDFMLKNYRYQEIHQIEIALKAIQQFYLGNTSQAIEYLYRKDKHIIVKQNHFRTSLKFILELQQEFMSHDEEKISKPFQKHYYHRSRYHNDGRMDEMEIEKIEKQDQEGQAKQQLQKKKQGQQQKQLNKLQQHINAQQEIQKNIDDISSSKQQIISQQDHHFQQNAYEKSYKNVELLNQQHPKDNQQQSQQQSSKNFHLLQQNPNIKRPKFNNHHLLNQNHNHHQNQQHQTIPSTLNLNLNPNQPSPIQQNLIFPPIPPYFYMPQFDQKYGHLFRKAIYIKKWKQIRSKMYQNQISDHFKQKEQYNLFKGYTNTGQPFTGVEYHQMNRDNLNNSGIKNNKNIIIPNPIIFSNQFDYYNVKN